jgi:hypothetical protein
MTAAMNLAEPVAGKKALFYFAGRIGAAPSQAELKSLRERTSNSQVAVYAIDTGETAAR